MYKAHMTHMCNRRDHKMGPPKLSGVGMHSKQIETRECINCPYLEMRMVHIQPVYDGPSAYYGTFA